MDMLFMMGSYAGVQTEIWDTQAVSAFVYQMYSNMTILTMNDSKFRF